MTMELAQKQILEPPPTVVIFRKWKPSHGGCVIALFPEEPSDHEGRFCESYEHVGQHGGADYHGVVRRTLPATETESRDLLEELTWNYGYSLVVKRKASPAMHNKRRKLAKE